jgi:hypothetical protein
MFHRRREKHKNRIKEKLMTHLTPQTSLFLIMLNV